MFQIIDTQNHHQPVKSGFKTPAQALKWAKKHLSPDTCSNWGIVKIKDRYFIKKGSK